MFFNVFNCVQWPQINQQFRGDSPFIVIITFFVPFYNEISWTEFFPELIDFNVKYIA